MPSNTLIKSTCHRSGIKIYRFHCPGGEALYQIPQYEFSGVVKPENDSQHYQLRYAEFVVPMVKPWEQQAMIKELQAQVAALIGTRD